MDLGNPSPALAGRTRERRSLLERANADVVLALALVHHLAIGRNVPLPMIADLFAGLGADLIVEFVPEGGPDGPPAARDATDVFADYTLDGFRAAFRRAVRNRGRGADRGQRADAGADDPAVTAQSGRRTSGAPGWITHLSRVPAYPALIAAAFVLKAYVEPIPPLHVFARPLLVAILVIVTAQVILSVLARDRDRGAYFGTLVVLVVVSQEVA